jgi:hypothetical protein
VLPLREDIAAPEFPHEPEWVGTDPGKMTPLLARRAVLVHFFDFSQLNSVRTLPYLQEWNRRYEPLGLTVLGIQAPRFSFGGDVEFVEKAVGDLGVEFPVMVDSDLAFWSAYGCEGWPSLFLWGRGGVLQWFHFGEGDYEGTERAIQGTLADGEMENGLPELMEPVRPTDRQGIEVIAPSPELLPAGEPPWTVEGDGASFEVEFEAGGVHATMTGQGSLELELDGESLPAVEVEGPGLYDLVELAGHGGHRLAVHLVGSPEIWSVSFSPATTRAP